MEITKKEVVTITLDGGELKDLCDDLENATEALQGPADRGLDELAHNLEFWRKEFIK